MILLKMLSMHTSKILGLILIFLCFATKAFSQNAKGGMSGVEEIKFKSAINNHDYVLHVKLPDSYNSDPSKKYPVMYATDGQWSFPLIMEIKGGLLYDNLVPEIIYVGITWPDNFFVNRIRDFFPTKTEQVPDAGGAEKFLNVIKLEIIKRIDSAYRTDKINNGLYGTSAGGFFTLYTLFHEPALFNRYITTSPSLDYYDGAAFKFEKAFAAKKHTHNAKLLSAMADMKNKWDLLLLITSLTG
jgi:predicted alpha/beta superfamily hydrolase